MTTTTTVKAREYRKLTDSLSYCFANLRGAARGERPHLAWSVRRAASRLMNARSPRSRREDLDAAERLIDLTASYLIEHGLTG